MTISPNKISQFVNPGYLFSGKVDRDYSNKTKRPCATNKRWKRRTKKKIRRYMNQIES